MQELSQWFNLSEQKPWQVGVYEVSNGLYFSPAYSAWDGASWSFTCNSVESAILNRSLSTKDKIIKWRGLSSAPSAPSHKPRGNRRVTRYVLMLDSDPIMVGNSMDEVRDYLKRSPNTWWTTVKTIRFRTPEASQA